MRVTIDTNIFVKSCKMEEYKIESDAFIMGFYNRTDYGMVIDYENKIRKEYWDNLGSNERFVQIYVALERQGRIDFVSGTMSKRYENKLNELGFHEAEDHVFVATAYNADKLLVTEDSDYGKGNNPEAQSTEKQTVLEYMTHNMELKIMDSKEGLAMLK